MKIHFTTLALAIPFFFASITSCKQGEKPKNANQAVHSDELITFESNPSYSDMFYDDALCYYEAGQYTEEQLRNTELLIGSRFEKLFEDEKLSDKLLEAKVEEAMKTCKIVEGDFWERLRSERIAEYKYYKDFMRIKQEAMTDPSVLKTGKFSGYCTEYIDALNGTDEELKAAWGKFAEGKGWYESYKTQVNLPDWKTYAVNRLIDFAWGNCVNDIYHKQKEERKVLTEEEITERFRKLFHKIEEEGPGCSEYSLE